MPARKCRCLGLMLLLLMVSADDVRAQDAQEIRSVVNRFFGAIALRQVDTMRSLLLPNATIASVGVGRDGSAAARSRAVSTFIDGVRSSNQTWAETVRGTDVRIQGSTAQLSGEYTFSIDGAVSHCGRVTVVLGKTSNGWLIGHIAETQQDQC